MKEKILFRKFFLIGALIVMPVLCSAQKIKDTSLKFSLDYGFGEFFNNKAYTLTLNYNLFNKLRISPSLSKFIKKENMRMTAFSIDFHHLLQKKNFNLFSESAQNNLFYYPIYGICILKASGQSSRCNPCTIDILQYKSNTYFNFGFDFGLGVEYKIPSTKNFFDNISISIEILYIAVENYFRPLIRSGILYKF